MAKPSILFVDPAGAYPTMDLDTWAEDRDARNYAGRAMVIAHPPCGPWSQGNYVCYEDPELAVFAVNAVRKWGGIVEHPAKSKLWKHLGLPLPGGLFKDASGGWTMEVYQSAFGHRAEKKTWLYVVGIEPSAMPALPPFRRATMPCQNMNSRERRQTPRAFARWLVEAASA